VPDPSEIIPVRCSCFAFSSFFHSISKTVRQLCYAGELAKVTTNIILVLRSETDFKILITRENMENENENGENGSENYAHDCTHIIYDNIFY